MPEPDEFRFACIGCGALNPSGAEVCSGCGYHFAGPVGGSILKPDPVSIPPSFEARLLDEKGDQKVPGREPDTSFLGCLLQVIGWTLVVIVTFVAFVVAFFVICTATLNTSGTLIWATAAGLTAGGLVLAFAFWIVSMTREDRR